MSGPVSCLLFSPPLPPLALLPGEEVVIGRSPSCAIPIASQQVSRRHARVVWQGAVVMVADLGSTNGTFVNGERLEGERVLQPGDRVEVGDSTITFCRVEAEAESSAAAPVEAQTILVERNPSRRAPEVLRGDLKEIPIFAVLQMLEMGSKTGLLSVRGAGLDGRLWMDAGRLVHAATEKRAGLDAALEIAQADSGRFDFAPEARPDQRSMEAGVTEVILEASRLLDEAEA